MKPPLLVHSGVWPLPLEARLFWELRAPGEHPSSLGRMMQPRSCRGERGRSTLIPP